MSTPNDIQRSLKILPRTLTEAYDEIFECILTQEGDAPRLALGAFRWVRHSYKPLRTETLLDAITVGFDDSWEVSNDTVQPDDLPQARQNPLAPDGNLNVFYLVYPSFSG